MSGFGDQNALESAAYISAMSKPLAEIAKTQGLHSLVYYLEMAILEAANVERALKSINRPEPPSIPPDQGA
jgi:hypothetical protein